MDNKFKNLFYLPPPPPPPEPSIPIHVRHFMLSFERAQRLKRFVETLEPQRKQHILEELQNLPPPPTPHPLPKPPHYVKKALRNRNWGVGSGNYPRRRKHSKREPVDCFTNWKTHSRTFLSLTKMSVNEFCEILEDMKQTLPLQRSGKARQSKRLTLENRLLLVLHWMACYRSLEQLSAYFGVSKTTAQREINHIIPFLECH